MASTAIYRNARCTLTRWLAIEIATQQGIRVGALELDTPEHAPRQNRKSAAGDGGPDGFRPAAECVRHPCERHAVWNGGHTGYAPGASPAVPARKSTDAP